MELNTNKLITDTEREIAKVLAKLETDTGMVVDTVEVKDINVTELGDSRTQLMRRVAIEMKRIPGARWSQ